MTQLTELDYESIENAVMETARGRWFLTEHKKRYASTDTPDILDAIARLEKVIISINDGDQAEMPAAPPLTGETADTAKTASPAFTPAIVDVPTSPAPETPEANPLSDENLQFFSNDEDLFADDNSSFLSDTVQGNDTAETTVAETTGPEVEQTNIAPERQEASAPEEVSAPAGERFKVYKSTPNTPQADAGSDDQDEANPVVPDPVMQPTTQEKDRIVVIRNTAGEDINIPLAEDFADKTDSDQLAPTAN